MQALLPVIGTTGIDLFCKEEGQFVRNDLLRMRRRFLWRIEKLSEITVSYEGSLRCSAEHAESGVVVVTDAPKDNHGNGMSFSPSELLSVSLGSCILSIMGIMARSLGIDISGATAIVEKEMANSPRRIARISVRVHVPGTVEEDQRRKLQSAAHACPVHNILNIEAPISFSWGPA